jgi:CRP-like cAMP-binding protein
MLDGLALFAAMSDDQRTQLAPKMQRHVFKDGETLLEQGAVSPFFYILHSGVLVAVQLHGSTPVEIFRLAPGDCFAQASVLTGAASLFKIRALTKSVVYEIAREDIAPILAQRPTIMAELVQMTQRREAEGRLAIARLDVGQAPADTFAGRIAGRMKLAFGLS